MSVSLDWARFFETEAPKLRRFLRRFGSAVSAEDVAQESFARLYAAEPKALGSPRAFLFRVARNLAVDQVRRGKASPVETAEDLDRLAARARWTKPSPEDELLAAETKRTIETALAGLSEDQRTALVLRKLEGLSPEEIAQRLGVSPRQVQRLIVQAIAQIQARLRASEDSAP